MKGMYYIYPNFDHLTLKRPTVASKAQVPIQKYQYRSIFIRSVQCFEYYSKILF